MQSSILNLSFYLVIYHSVLSNNFNKIIPPVFSSCIEIVLELISKRSNHIFPKFTPSIINWKQINMKTMKQRYTCAARCWSLREYSYFDFLAHSIFTFTVFCDGLGTNIFGNLSWVVSNTRPRLPFFQTILSFLVTTMTYLMN